MKGQGGDPMAEFKAACRGCHGGCMYLLTVEDGRVVKGINFVDLVDAGDPVECGKAYDAAGADELVFLDITASSDRRAIVTDMVRRVAETVFIPFAFRTSNCLKLRPMTRHISSSGVE